MYRNTSNEKRYRIARVDQHKCPFCGPKTEEIVSETPNFYVLKNIFGYDAWDQKQVHDHLMIVPKSHDDNFINITPEVSHEYLELVNDFANQGYDVFTRSTSSITKTQPHLHTHLIKTSDQKITKLEFSSSPYKMEFE